jgi:hypothetical protein
VENFFNQLLNVHGVHDVRQMDIQTAEPLVPEPSLVIVETAIEKLRKYKSLGTDQFLAKLIKAGGETLHSKIHEIRSTLNKEEVPQQWKNLLLYQFIKTVIRLTVIITKESPLYQLPTQHSSGKVNSVCQCNY